MYAYIYIYTKYITDLPVRSSEPFETSKSWAKKASNRQKKSTTYSSLQSSLNHQVVFKTIVAGSFVRTQFRIIFY